MKAKDVILDTQPELLTGAKVASWRNCWLFTLTEISGQIGAAQDVVCFWMHYEFSAMSARFLISCLACVAFGDLQETETIRKPIYCTMKLLLCAVATEKHLVESTCSLMYFLYLGLIRNSSTSFDR